EGGERGGGRGVGAEQPDHQVVRDRLVHQHQVGLAGEGGPGVLDEPPRLPVLPAGGQLRRRHGGANDQRDADQHADRRRAPPQGRRCRLRGGGLRGGRLQSGRLRAGWLRDGPLRRGRFQMGRLRGGGLRRGGFQDSRFQGGRLQGGRLRGGRFQDGRLRGGRGRVLGWRG